MDWQIDNFWSCANPLASIRGFHDLTWKGIGNCHFGKQFLDHPLLAWRFLMFRGSSMFFWLVQVLNAPGLHSGVPKFANKTYDFGPFRSLGTPSLPDHPSETQRPRTKMWMIPKWGCATSTMKEFRQGSPVLLIKQMTFGHSGILGLQLCQVTPRSPTLGSSTLWLVISYCRLRGADISVIFFRMIPVLALRFLRFCGSSMFCCWSPVF